jgi:hypothetical protein
MGATTDYTDYTDGKVNAKVEIRNRRIAQSRRGRGENEVLIQNSQKKGRRWEKVEGGEGVDSVAGLSLRVKRKKKVESKERAMMAIAIMRGYGLLKRKPGDQSFEEERAEYKREELALGEAKYARCVGSR